MKMESSIRAEQDGVISMVHIQPGSQIDAKDLLMEFEA
jgi:pyruvate carboxylase